MSVAVEPNVLNAVSRMVRVPFAAPVLVRIARRVPIRCSLVNVVFARKFRANRAGSFARLATRSFAPFALKRRDVSFFAFRATRSTAFRVVRSSCVRIAKRFFAKSVSR